MTEREKVIKGLDLCLSGESSACNDCPYDVECKEAIGIGPSPLRRDALELLKKQEPMMVRLTTSTIRCPKCGKQITSRGAIHREIKFCWKCGQELKWE